MIELTEEELRTARLWCGAAMCLEELGKAGKTKLYIGRDEGFNTFALSDLGRRIVGGGVPIERHGEYWEWYKAMVSDPVREALGIKKL